MKRGEKTLNIAWNTISTGCCGINSNLQVYIVGVRCAPADGKLTTPERVALCAWSFDSTFGNGFWTVLLNEDCRMIVMELWALEQLGSSRLVDFVAAIRETFTRFGIEATSDKGLAEYATFPDSRREALKAALKQTEQPFLDDIWHKCIIQSAAADYIRRNLDGFGSAANGG